MNPMNNSHVIHPAVVRVTTSVLVAHGYAGRALQLAVAHVSARAVETLDDGRRAPRTLRAWQDLVAETAEDYAERHGRTRLVPASEDGVDGSDDGILHWDILCPCTRDAARRQKAVLEDMLAREQMPDGARTILALVAEGVPFDGIGKALKLTPGEVRRRLRNTRARFFRRLLEEPRVSQAEIDREVNAFLAELFGTEGEGSGGGEKQGA